MSDWGGVSELVRIVRHIILRYGIMLIGDVLNMCVEGIKVWVWVFGVGGGGEGGGLEERVR